ncbi:MAG: pyruvate kinase [Patescibacteria group bacterium]
MHFQRKTKIIATIGPASETRENLTKLIEEGIAAARLNFSHDTHEGHRKRIRLIRQIEKKIGRPVAIIGDLQGPKMRVGVMPKEGVLLRDEEVVVLDTSIDEYREGMIPIPSPIFEKGAVKGSQVFLDDGSLLLEVMSMQNVSLFSRRGKRFTARVVRGGTLYSHKGINVPQLKLRTNIFEEKDKRDLAFAIREGVDYIAVSFIRNAHDVREARAMLKGAPVKLISKIERPEALVHLEEIIAASDAIMVARGDLGIETPLWQLPTRQKEIIDKAHRAMKPVIVATQMLESMTKNVIPTRAEVSDVANAVYDSADAVMLSAESASGRHPVEAVRMMRHILEGTEKDALGNFENGKDENHSTNIAIAKSAKFIASQIGAKVIVAGTTSGITPLAVSKYRPSTPIVAATSDERVARSCAIIWGVVPVVLRGARSVDQILKMSTAYLKKEKHVAHGDLVVFVSGAKLGHAGETNSLSVILVP